MMYARYSPTVQIAVIAKYAQGKPTLLPKYAGIVMISAATEPASTANSGTRWRFRRRNSHHPGMPLSREHAYHVREQLVSPAAPQNSWPTVQMSKTALAAAVVSEVSMIGIEPPPFSVIAGTFVAANTSASSTAHPAIAG